MKLKQVTHRLTMPAASIENLEEHRYWLQCERAYTYQPIYKTNGQLLAVELLTVVTHPSHPQQRIAPDRYFAAIPVRLRLNVIQEQLQMLKEMAAFFLRHNVLASVNVDGPTLMAMRERNDILAAINELPWVRFELVEHIRLPENSDLSGMNEFGPLWLDDFGTGMANFSALSEVRYDYIKVARELFIMLRTTPEGRNLFTQLLQLMNRYCNGVIVEGIETLDEWQDVQGSPALAAQGYFLSRPVCFSTLNEVEMRLN